MFDIVVVAKTDTVTFQPKGFANTIFAHCIVGKKFPLEAKGRGLMLKLASPNAFRDFLQKFPDILDTKFQAAGNEVVGLKFQIWDRLDHRHKTSTAGVGGLADVGGIGKSLDKKMYSWPVFEIRSIGPQMQLGGDLIFKGGSEEQFDGPLLKAIEKKFMHGKSSTESGLGLVADLINFFAKE